jgi:serine/threonine protein kinase
MADVATVAELFADKYDVTEKLDWNGLALVYKATRKTGEPLAIAMLPIDTESSPDAIATFKSKATELQLLVEPGIVRVSGHGVQHGVPYLELEYTDATTLADELLDGPLDRDQAFMLTSELLDILGRAHAGGHFHWDLTPSNILLAPGMDGSEHASVVGFGIQQIIRAVFDPEKTGPTGRGSGPKATRYLAPELKDARTPDARADVFGVAAVLHHMLTGSPPGPESPSPPADLAPALAQAMSEDPNARPADAATFGFTLAEGASGGRGEAPSFAPPASSMPFASQGVPAAPDVPDVPLPAEAAPEPPPQPPVADAAPEFSPQPPVADAAPEPPPQPPVAEAVPEPPLPTPVADAAPPSPFGEPAPTMAEVAHFDDDTGPLPSVTEDADLSSDATVVDARALSEEDWPEMRPASAAVQEEPLPDYESLGPPMSAAAEKASHELDALLGGPTSGTAAGMGPPAVPGPPPPASPEADPDVVMSPAPAPGPARSGPRDPFASTPPPPGALEQNPYGGDELIEQEKKTGSMIAALIMLTIAVALVVAFFVIKSSG